MDMIPGEIYVMDYENWKGERRLRRVKFIQLIWDVVSFHGPRPNFYLQVETSTPDLDLLRDLLGEKEYPENLTRYFDGSRVYSVSRDMSEQSRPWEARLD